MVAPAEVHATLRRHLLVDGFDLVLDTRASRGSTLVDARDGRRYLDVFSLFASSALGMNHPALTDDANFLATLTEVAVNKPSNSDVYTTHLAAFTETDIVAFGKKTQVCGIMAGGRLDEVTDNVFAVPGRLNSTWGGNLTDMVRARRILEVIAADDLVATAAVRGKHLLGLLSDLVAAYPRLVDNPRGRGLMCALDLPTPGLRDEVIPRLRTEERVLAIGSGERTLRFRPALTVSEEELSAAVAALARVLAGLAAERRP